MSASAGNDARTKAARQQQGAGAAERPATKGSATKPVEKRAPSRIHATWDGEQRFDAGRPGGKTLRLDGTGKTGQSPVDVLLSALAGCTGIDIVEILAKRRTPVERLEIEVVGDRADVVPRRIIAIQLIYRIDGAGIDRDQAERAIDLAVNKYCSVRESLATDIVISWSMTLNGEPYTPGGA
jgi:putative redox protein